MSRLRPLRPRLLPPPAAAPTDDEPIARAVRNLLWARSVAAQDARRPTSMRASLSFWTSTSSTAAEWPRSSAHHQLELLGWDRGARRIYLAERTDDRATLFVMATWGEHAGVALPLAGDPARIAALRAQLTPLVAGSLRGWALTTRVVQRRGLRLEGMATPVRKFALGLSVSRRNAGVALAAGRATVTAYLRPRAVLHQVWEVPGEPLAVAVASYCGVPAGIGLDRQVALLAAPPLQ